MRSKAGIRGQGLGAESRVRGTTLEDADALADLLVALDLFPVAKEKTLEDVKRHVREKFEACRDNPSHAVFVAEGEAGLLGYAAVHWLPCLFGEGPDGYLSELFVIAEARGQRVGSSLLEAVVEEAKRRGCGRLTLINRRDRASYTRGFYRKRGWTEQPEAARFVCVLGAA